MKKINFLGMEFDVAEEHDIDEAHARGERSVYVVPPVTQVDITQMYPTLQSRATRTLCEVCSAVCWFDPNSYAPLAILNPEIICIPCATKRMREQR